MNGWMEVMDRTVEVKHKRRKKKKEGRVSQSPAPVPFHFLGCAVDRTGMCGSALIFLA